MHQINFFNTCWIPCVKINDMEWKCYINKGSLDNIKADIFLKENYPNNKSIILPVMCRTPRIIKEKILKRKLKNMILVKCSDHSDTSTD